MKKYEYATSYQSCDDVKEYKIADYLNQQGVNGWELVQIIERNFLDNPIKVANRTFIFKREIIEK